MELYHVQVNHLTDPMGFLMKRVCFSWKVRGATGTRQVSARAVVAEDEDLSRVLLYTGFDPAADSLGWRVPLGLRPRTRYYFQITVRSDAEEEASSAVHWFETGKMDEPWQAQWVTCDSVEKRHPWFEKEIAPREKVTQARLYICGLGLYEAYFNGTRIGNEYLTPYSNDYNRWMQAQTFDVTQQLQTSGTLSVLLGNGWYKARFGFAAHEDVGFYGNEWKLIAELHLAYTDGTEEIIGTDDSWTVRRSRITFSNLYDGERRDDTLPELHPERPILCPPPKGTLTDRMSTPVTVHETFAPVELLHTPKGELVLDMGQEFTGSFRLKVDVPKGQAVHIQTGEILQQGCFYNENLRTAKSEYWYISNGEPVVLQPHFTFYGYRYVKIDGIPDLKKEDFTGLALYSEIPQRGTMRTGHALLNQFLSNVRWGLKSNFLDVPTDCPQRDERMGWTGDIAVFSPTACYNFDMGRFLNKWMLDVKAEQFPGGGIPNTVPRCGYGFPATMPDMAVDWWDDACVLVPWAEYRARGDVEILRKYYPVMKKYVKACTFWAGLLSTGKNKYIWHTPSVFHFGDWVAPDVPKMGQWQARSKWTATASLRNTSGLVARIAEILGEKADAAQYRDLSEKVADAYCSILTDGNGKLLEEFQTAYVLPLYLDMFPNREVKKRAADNLVKLVEKNDYCIGTGFPGTPYILFTLADNGHADTAYKMLLNTKCPSWLYEVKMGATTIWERWDGLDENGVCPIGDDGTDMMISYNHYASGAVGDFLYRRVLGLEAVEPGYRTFSVKPVLGGGLTWAGGGVRTPYGEASVKWKIDGGVFTIAVQVPVGTTCELTLPDGTQKVYHSGRHEDTCPLSDI